MGARLCRLARHVAGWLRFAALGSPVADAHGSIKNATVASLRTQEKSDWIQTVDLDVGSKVERTVPTPIDPGTCPLMDRFTIISGYLGGKQAKSERVREIREMHRIQFCPQTVS